MVMAIGVGEEQAITTTANREEGAATTVSSNSKLTPLQSLLPTSMTATSISRLLMLASARRPWRRSLRRSYVLILPLGSLRRVMGRERERKGLPARRKRW